MILNNFDNIIGDVVGENDSILVLRADATTAIGIGHLMRCIALAQAWRAKGNAVIFLSRCQNGVLIDRIKSEGFYFIPIAKSYPDPDDLELTLNFLSQCQSFNPAANSWLTIDGYHFDESYQRMVRDRGFKVLVIDDHHHLPQYCYDVILNQNIGAVTLDYSCAFEKYRLMGPRYILLRKEFLNHSGYKDTTKETIRNVLITLGGADLENATLTVLKGLIFLRIQNLHVKLVVGPANLNLAELESDLTGSPIDYEIVRSPTNMPDLMSWADVAISAAGSTCWELAYMGVPSAVLVLADNQEIIAKGLEKSHAALNLGRIGALTMERFEACIRPLMESKAKRMEIIQNQRKLVDGSGAERVIRLMESENERLGSEYSSFAD
jgi:UDP-2,4-diacetamido-2,4,6-trideoxy-beta-L-altropyranose hydrolase